MKIQILSDLHLEFEDMKLPKTDADIIVLAGDIHSGIKGIQWAQKQEKKKLRASLPKHTFPKNGAPVLSKQTFPKKRRQLYR